MKKQAPNHLCYHLYMFKKLITYLVFASLTLLAIPYAVKAQAYGSGTYGNCQYGTSCSSTSTTSNSNLLTILANGQELKPNAEFPQGAPIIFSGTTVPLAEVHLYFQSEPFEAIVNADTNGHWSYTLTKNLGAGEHSLQIAIRIPETNTIGEKSAPKTFILSTEAVVPTTTAANSWWPYAAVGLTAVIVLVTLIWTAKKRRGTSK